MGSWLGWENRVIRIFSPGCQHICHQGEGSGRSLADKSSWVPGWERSCPAGGQAGRSQGSASDGAERLCQNCLAGPWAWRPAKQGHISPPVLVLSPHPHPVGSSCLSSGPPASPSSPECRCCFPQGLHPAWPTHPHPTAAAASSSICPAQPADTAGAQE